MMIMPANNASGFVHYWAGKNPGCIGHIHSPSTRRSFYPWLPIALDNDRFIYWDKGVAWDEAKFIEHWDIARYSKVKVLWGLVPDVVCDKEATLEDWYKWQPRLHRYGFPLAIAVQDGMTPADIPKNADVIFVGGSDSWKFANLHRFLALNKPVHVGRVNGNRLWQLHQLGVTSCDGSGWFRGDKHQLAKLNFYLKFLAGEVKDPTNGQLSLLV